MSSSQSKIIQFGWDITKHYQFYIKQTEMCSFLGHRVHASIAIAAYIVLLFNPCWQCEVWLHRRQLSLHYSPFSVALTASQRQPCPCLDVVLQWFLTFFAARIPWTRPMSSGTPKSNWKSIRSGIKYSIPWEQKREKKRRIIRQSSNNKFNTQFYYNVSRNTSLPFYRILLILLMGKICWYSRFVFGTPKIDLWDPQGVPGPQVKNHCCLAKLCVVFLVPVLRYSWFDTFDDFLSRTTSWFPSTPKLS